MPLYLVTNVCDEGVNENSFRVVEAPTRLAVVQHIMRAGGPWMRWLERSHLLNGFDGCSAEQLLARIDATRVDGDSEFQFAIHEIRSIDRVGRPGMPAQGEGPRVRPEGAGQHRPG